jgi:hypothetical protein
MTSIARAAKSPTCVENTGNCLFWYFAGLATLIPHPRFDHGTKVPCAKQKGANMFPTLTRFARFIDNYRFYRRRGFHFRAAWQLANMTLPE